MMDSRIEERRAEVAEKRARRNVVRLVVLLAIVGVVAGVVWLLRSPFLSVQDVLVEGVENSAVRSRLEDQDIEPGRPMVLIRGARVEEELERDPWVADADFSVMWPDRVKVTITEKTPVIWASINGQWSLVAGDGTVLDEANQPDPSLMVAEVAGQVRADSPVLAEVAAFAEEIPAVFRDGAQLEVDGDIATAVVENYTIQLGRPVDLGDKGKVTARLISSGIEHGSVINVSSALNPAVLSPTGGNQDEGDEGPSDTETTVPSSTTVPSDEPTITTVVG